MIEYSHLSKGLEYDGARDRDGHVNVVNHKQWLLESGVGTVGQVVCHVHQHSEGIPLWTPGERGRWGNGDILVSAVPHSLQSSAAELSGRPGDVVCLISVESRGGPTRQWETNRPL